MIRRTLKWAALSAPLALTLSACMANMADQETELDSQSAELSVPQPLLPRLYEFNDPEGVGRAALIKSQLVINSQAEYVAHFGHKAPAPVNFDRGDAVLFYSAGRQPSGGYDVSFSPFIGLRQPHPVSTKLEVPGEGCAVTLAITTPYQLAYIPWANLKDIDRDGDVDEAIRWLPTKVEKVDCQEYERCGGIAPFPCEDDNDECVDDPRDTCDPKLGGADCSGICVPVDPSPGPRPLPVPEPGPRPVPEPGPRPQPLPLPRPTPISPCAVVLCADEAVCVVNEYGRAECVPAPVPTFP
jgi:hypothetical protein